MYAREKERGREREGGEVNGVGKGVIKNLITKKSFR